MKCYDGMALLHLLVTFVVVVVVCTVIIPLVHLML
jgi:hypothetical protein